MSRFVEKRPEVEARQYTGKASDISGEFIQWLGIGARVTNRGYGELVVHMMAEDMTVSLKPGDWIVRTSSDDGVTTRVMSHSVFSAVYEKAVNACGADELFAVASAAVGAVSRKAQSQKIANPVARPDLDEMPKEEVEALIEQYVARYFPSLLRLSSTGKVFVPDRSAAEGAHHDA